ncbi:hypothetical protein RCL1_008496 [Eukaryota sp. TZLM3-RCL]
MGNNNSRFSAEKASVYLKTSRIRLQQLQNKKTNLVMADKRAIGDLLKAQKHEIARIKCEQVIRDNLSIEAYHILENLCELVLARIHVIAEAHEVPVNMQEAIHSLIYAAPLTEVPELLTLREVFATKYGREFVQHVQMNEAGFVNQKLITKLVPEDISPAQLEANLVEIARHYNIEYTPLYSEHDHLQPLKPNHGGNIDDVAQIVFPVTAADSLDSLEVRHANLRNGL